jgi:hypothetical protein
MGMCEMIRLASTCGGTSACWEMLWWDVVSYDEYWSMSIILSSDKTCKGHSIVARHSTNCAVPYFMNILESFEWRRNRNRTYGVNARDWLPTLLFAKMPISLNRLMDQMAGEKLFDLVERIKRVSPIAWRHINLGGRFKLIHQKKH